MATAASYFKRYLERCAKIQAGLMICVYCLSYAPALLELKFEGFPPEYNYRLLFFFVLVVVAGDAFSYGCEKLMGKHVIVPAINAQKTWEGVLGGIGCATLFGAGGERGEIGSRSRLGKAFAPNLVAREDLPEPQYAVVLWHVGQPATGAR